MPPAAANSPRISAEGRWLRVGLAAAILLAAGILAFPGAGTIRPFLPCGFRAITGLPCLFCGGTRAMCAILHGNPRGALYLNALAFPALAFAAAVFFALLIEAAAGRPLARREFFLRCLNRFAPALILLALGWWIFHLVLALTTPKPELVDFRNPLAAWAKTVAERAGR